MTFLPRNPNSLPASLQGTSRQRLFRVAQLSRLSLPKTLNGGRKVKSCKKSLHNLKIARAELVSELLLFRSFGIKTTTALGRLAAFCGISPRRAYAIVFNQSIAPLGDKECEHTELGALAAQRWLADYLCAWSHELHRRADLKEMLIRERKAACGSTAHSLNLLDGSAITSGTCLPAISSRA